jgi:acyl-CoA synthetase (AMP-forming)/AMP-acid ligase II
MPPGLLAEADAALSAGFAQGYGMTELSGNAVFLSADDHRRGLAGDERLLAATGRPGPGVELRITGDDGRVLPPGEAGEVRVRAAQVCAGYWDDPEATAAAMVDGWLRTGDIGVLDDDQLLTIVDRAKDIIVTGGENVASREVEDVIGRHPLVGRVAVIGIPDDHWGEAVCAVVVVRADAEHDPTTTAADIRARAGTGLARFKVPKRVVFVDELPVNAGGKVIKAELRRRVAADAAHHPDGG